MDGYIYYLYTALNNIVGFVWFLSSDGCSKSKVAANRQTWKGGEITPTTPLCILESFHNGLHQIVCWCWLLYTHLQCHLGILFTHGLQLPQSVVAGLG